MDCRTFAAETVRRTVCRKTAGLPTPPARLMPLVMSGGRPFEMPFRYAIGGRNAAADIRAVLDANHLRMRDFRAVLDFGCGCGRVIRYFQGLPVRGTDIDAQMIRWCRRHLPFQFDTNGPLPPLDYADGTFDFIYALSVFTHLDEPAQVAWRDELVRVLAPGGHLLFSTHGDRSRHAGGDLAYVTAGDVGSNAFGTYQSARHVRDVLLDGLVEADYRPWAALGLGGQDIWLARKR